MTQPVPILHLITQLPIGGAQDNTLLTVGGLDRAAFRVDLAAGSGGAWAWRARQAADRFIELPHLRREVTALDDMRTVFALVKLLRKERYRLIHTHSSKAGLLGRIAATIARTPVILHTIHGFAFNDLSFSASKRRAFLWLERFGARLSDHLIFVSELNRQEALRRGIGTAERMEVVYSGIDLGRFGDLPSKQEARARLEIPPEHDVVGSVGRLASCNAPLLLVEAAQALLQAQPNLTFLIVGDDPEWRPRVEAAIGKESRIRLLGYREDIPALLPALDVFVSTNLWAGLGRALTEAMAAGLPVVAFPVNGVPELVQDGVTGLHATVGDAADVARQTARLLHEPALAHLYGENGRALVHSRWSALHMVAGLDALYRRLLAERNVTPATAAQRE